MELEEKLQKQKSIDSDAYFHQKLLLLRTNAPIMKVTNEKLVWKKKVCCSALQYVTVSCSVLQCVVVPSKQLLLRTNATVMNIAHEQLVWKQKVCSVCCSVLQCVAVCCSALQCVAVRCSALK